MARPGQAERRAAAPVWTMAPLWELGGKQERGPSGAGGVWAGRVESPGHRAPQMPLLQGETLGADAAGHLLGAQREPENVLVIALLILQGKQQIRTGQSDSAGARPAPTWPPPARARALAPAARR